MKPFTDDHYWEKAFPCLFPYGRGGPTDKDRRSRLTDFKYDQHTLLESRNRLSGSKQWIFPRYKQSCSRNANSVAFVADKVGDKTPNLSELYAAGRHAEAGVNRKRLDTDVEKLLQKLSTFGGSMKTTHYHIRRARKHFMVRLASAEMSSPTWFITLSSADLYWPELWVAIAASKGQKMSFETAAQTSFADRCKLLDDNPALACRLFKSRIDCILQYIFRGEAHPIGYLVDWWFRVEFQNRGSLHIHAILWALLHYRGKWYNGDEMSKMMTNKNNTVSKEPEHNVVVTPSATDDSSAFAEVNVAATPSAADESSAFAQDMQEINSVKGPLSNNTETSLLFTEQLYRSAENANANNATSCTPLVEKQCHDISNISTRVYDSVVDVESESDSDSSSSIKECKVEINDSDSSDSDFDIEISSSTRVNRDSKTTVPLDDDFKPVSGSFLTKIELAEMISQYMNANMPTAESCGFDPNDMAFNNHSIKHDSLDHASLEQKTIPDGFDYEFCNPREQRDLLNLIRSFQVHCHRDTCFKKSCLCRFNYPWPLRPKTLIRYVKLQGTKEWQLRVLAERNHHMVNNYNGWTVLNFRANTDIQFICNPYGTATYCCLYTSKAEAPDKTIISKKS